MQHSIFEPLYSLQAHCNMEECQAPMPFALSQASSKLQAPSLFSISPSSLHAINRENSPSSFDQDIPCSLHAHIITPTSTSNYKKPRSEQDFTSDLTHVKLPLTHPTLSATTLAPPCSITANSTNSKLSFSHSFTSRDDDRTCDDGSVASKLLSSITKSISSPSLHLRSCKEAARETSYQKTLKLKQMKLHHCAEALGLESSDNSSFLYDSQCVYQEKIDMIGNPSSCPPSFTFPNSHQESSLKSVKSAPNLRSAPPLMTNHSRYSRSTSFPPPLSHTLPTSSSYDSLSLSLRVCREDGRFILKETMVPSKHYLHANRGNGRLTLHVFTREEEEEEHSGSQDDHEEFSYQESQRRKVLEEEEEDILQCMVSLYEEKLDGGFDNKEEDSTNTIQSLNEKVCGKNNLVMDSSKEIDIAARHLNMRLQRLNCLALHNKKKDIEDDDKRNAISNVITLSLKTSSHSKVTLHTAQVLSLVHLSIFPLVSGTLKKSALIHSAERNHGLIPRNHDITFPQSNENFIWETNLMPRAAANGSPRKQRKGSGGGGGGVGGGGSGVALPAFAMEEMRAKSLMKAVSDLATSLILETSYTRGNWCLEGNKKPSLSAVESGESGTIIGGYASKSAIMNGDEGQISEGNNFGYNTNEEEKANNTSEGGMKELNITSSPLQFPSSNANLQSEEWLHTLHCKELFDRHQLGQCFMKIHCILTRS